MLLGAFCTGYGAGHQVAREIDDAHRIRHVQHDIERFPIVGQRETAVVEGAGACRERDRGVQSHGAVGRDVGDDDPPFVLREIQMRAVVRVEHAVIRRVGGAWRELLLHRAGGEVDDDDRRGREIRLARAGVQDRRGLLIGPHRDCQRTSAEGHLCSRRRHRLIGRDHGASVRLGPHAKRGPSWNSYVRPRQTRRETLPAKPRIVKTSSTSSCARDLLFSAAFRTPRAAIERSTASENSGLGICRIRIRDPALSGEACRKIGVVRDEVLIIEKRGRKFLPMPQLSASRAQLRN